MTTALERVQNRAAQVADKRAQDWATLQREVPDVAALLVAVAAAFGKPAEVCERLGRQWIGIELNPEYVGLAHRRSAQRGLGL